MTVGMGFCSAPAWALTADNAAFAEDFLLFNPDAATLGPLSAATPSPDEGFVLSTHGAASRGLLLFFSAPSALSAVEAFRFWSARAIASASHAAFTLPRDAGRLLFHAAEPSSPAICAIVRFVRTDVSYESMSKPETT